MSLPFDATLKDLAGEFPRDFLATFDGAAPEDIALLNVDLSTVTTSADLIIGIGKPVREIVHIDFQSSAAATKHADVIAYNVLLFRHYLVPVHSIVLLLRPSAAHSALNGTVAYSPRPGRGKMDFGYEVVSLWNRPAEALVAGALGVVPLAVLGRLPENMDLPSAMTGIAEQVIERLEREAAPATVRKLLTAAYILSGLRLRRDRLRPIFERGIRTMRDSDTYMAIIDEGREEQIKKDILQLARQRFGQGDSTIPTRLEGITDLDRLERIHSRLLVATSWQDLLDTQ